MAGRKKRRRRAHRAAQQKGGCGDGHGLQRASATLAATTRRQAGQARPARVEAGPVAAGPTAVSATLQPRVTRPPVTDDRPPVLRVWRNRNYLLFETGWVPQSITSWIQRVGVTWLAWELSHSNTWVGAVAAADLAPMIVLAPFAGAVTDRSGDPMRLLKITKLLLLVQAIALAGLALAGIMSIEILFALSLFTGLVNPFAASARQIVLAGSVARQDFAAGIALDSALFQATRFVGPALAAVMIAMWGVPITFLAHVVGSVVIVVCLGMMRIEPPPRRDRLRRGILVDIIDSVAYVRAHGAIWPLFLLLTIASTLLRPIQELLPGFASKVFGAGPEGLGWLASAMGVGAMISASLIAVRGRIQGLSDWAIAGGVMLVVATLGFCASDRLWLGLVFAALMAFSINTMSTSIQTITQATVQDDMRGRVMSLYSLIFRGLPAIGAVVLGVLADRIGLQTSFMIAAAVSLLVWALVAVQRRRIAAAVVEVRR